MPGIVEGLLVRVEMLRAKGRLQELLKRVKDRSGLAPSDLRATGTTAQVLDSAREAIDSKYLSVEELAAFVDEFEEHGSQHVFLYRAKPAVRPRLTESHLRKHFAALPKAPTEALYAELPAASRTYVVPDRAVLTVKQIRSAVWWVQDEDTTTEKEDKRTRVIRQHRERARAVNLLIYDPRSGIVEVRIDRASDRLDHGLMVGLYGDFRDTFADVLDFEEDLTAIPIWNGFSSIVLNTDETYMSTDEAKDPSINHRLSNRRGGDAGTDVRLHHAYDMRDASYVRSTLNVYWKYDAPRGEEKIHTILSKYELKQEDGSDPRIVAKIYFGGRLHADAYQHVIKRILHYSK